MLMSRAKPKTDTQRLGLVESFALERLVPEPRNDLTCSEAFSAYRADCERRNLIPSREAEFTRSLEALARAAGMSIRQRGSNLSFLDTTLRGRPMKPSKDKA